MSSHCSPESEDSTSASSEPGSESSDNAKPTQDAGKCCGGIGPECRCRKMSPPLTGNGLQVMASMPHRTLQKDGTTVEGFAERPVVDALHGPTGNKEPLILSAEASPAKTSPLPESEPALPGKDQDCSMKPHESQTLFSDQGDGSSLRTYPDYLAPMEELTSGSYSRRWPTSGFTTSPGEFWTADTSECPNGGGEYSSLPDVLEATVPSRFYLSPKAAAGILRRATRRGKNLPPALDKALRDLLDNAAQEATPNLTDTEPTSQETA